MSRTEFRVLTHAILFLEAWLMIDSDIWNWGEQIETGCCLISISLGQGKTSYATFVLAPPEAYFLSTPDGRRIQNSTDLPDKTGCSHLTVQRNDLLARHVQNARSPLNHRSLPISPVLRRLCPLVWLSTNLHGPRAPPARTEGRRPRYAGCPTFN